MQAVAEVSSWRSSPRLLKGSTASRTRGARGGGAGAGGASTADGRADEPVAAARQRLHEARVVGIVAERRAQPLHGGVEAVLEIHVGAVRPQLPPQLLARHHLAGPPQQQAKDFERLILQAYPCRSRPQLPRPFVELERAEPESAFRP